MPRGWLLFGACFYCSHMSPGAAKVAAAMQVPCELDGDLMCCLRRAVVVWRHLQPLPQGDPNLLRVGIPCAGGPGALRVDASGASFGVSEASFEVSLQSPGGDFSAGVGKGRRDRGPRGLPLRQSGAAVPAGHARATACCCSGIRRITFHLFPDMLMDLLNHSPDLCCCRYN